MSNVKVEVKNLKQIKRDLERMKKAPQIVLDRTFSDVKQRGPSWIAKGVTERYGIKKKEILDGSVGQLIFQGDGIHNLQLEYSGRMLTPVHFNMRPISPPSPGNPYTIKATIYKGNRQTIGKIKKLTKKQRANIGRNFTHQSTRNSPQSPNMLQHTGNAKAGGVDYIPFQRGTQPGKRDKKFTTVSLPQMVTEGKNGPMHPEVANRFCEGLEKRVNHHMKLLEK